MLGWLRRAVHRRRHATRARDFLGVAARGRTPLRWELAVGQGIQEPVRLRGEGVLALFADELVFVKLTSGEETRIPLRDLRDVTRLRSLESFDDAPIDGDGDGTFHEHWLALDWKIPEGAARAAWSVDDVDAWIAALAGVRP